MAYPPPPIVIAALIDTGAEATVIDTATLAPLVQRGLQPQRFVFLNAPAAVGNAVVGAGIAPEYLVSIELPQGGARPLRLRSHPVLDQNLNPAGYAAVIGRDVLLLCTLYYDGPGRRFTLGY